MKEAALDEHQRDHHQRAEREQQRIERKHVIREQDPNAAGRDVEPPRNPARSSRRARSAVHGGGPAGIERRRQLHHRRSVRMYSPPKCPSAGSATSDVTLPGGVVGSSRGPSVGAAPGAPANASVGKRPCSDSTEVRSLAICRPRFVRSTLRARPCDHREEPIPGRPEHPPTGGRSPDRSCRRGHVLGKDRPADPEHVDLGRDVRGEPVLDVRHQRPRRTGEPIRIGIEVQQRGERGDEQDLRRRPVGMLPPGWPVPVGRG